MAAQECSHHVLLKIVCDAKRWWLIVLKPVIWISNITTHAKEGWASLQT